MSWPSRTPVALRAVSDYFSDLAEDWIWGRVQLSLGILGRSLAALRG